MTEFSIYQINVDRDTANQDLNCRQNAPPK